MAQQIIDNTAPDADTLFAGSNKINDNFTELYASTSFDVKSYGATGNGATDDTAAIQATMNAVPSAGGEVFFPRGDYLVTAPLVPKSNTLLRGTHVVRYQTDYPAVSSCKIRVGSGFTGSGLIAPGTSKRGLGFQNLCLDGAGVGSNIDGIFSALTTSAEYGWTFNNVQITRFTGSGFHGSLHVAMIDGLHLDHNYGWGWNVDGTHKLNDVKIVNMFVYVNRTGGINVDSSASSGAVDFANVRVERSGGNHANVQAPLNFNAPGIRLRKMKNTSFTNLTTDANTGHGLDIEYTSAGLSGSVIALNFTNSMFMRDGYGDGVTLPDRAGVYLKGFSPASADAVNGISFYNCRNIIGKASDNGDWPAFSAPARGVWMENTSFVNWIGPKPQGVTSTWHYGAAGQGSNWKPQVWDMETGIQTVYRSSTRPTSVFGGSGAGSNSMMFDSIQDNLIIYDGTNWRDVAAMPTKTYTDASGTITIPTTDPKILYFNTILTAQLNLTLPGSGSGRYNGMTFRIVRGASATGAFNIVIGTGTAKSLTGASQWADVTYTGSAWIVAASGTT